MPRRSNKPNCPHCQNLGLDSKHWLRKTADSSSDICCPVLLKTECKYCHKSGHNVSKCAKLLAKKAAMSVPSVTESIHIQLPPQKKGNTYASMVVQVLECPENTKVSVSSNRRNIRHSWADDDYWASSDSDNE
jgi:hypothetical protein